jgi:hypothetical protein
VLLRPISQDHPITIDAIDSPYASVPSLQQRILERGLDVPAVLQAPPEK